MAFYAVFEGLLTKLEIVLIIFFAGFILAKLADRIVRRLLSEAELNEVLVAAGFKPLSDVFGLIIKYVIYAATLLVVLQQLGLTKLVLGVLVVLAVFLLGFFVFLTARDLIPNLVAWFFLRKKIKPFVGKKVCIGSVEGKLVRFGFVGSTVRNKDVHFVPHLYTSKQRIRLLRAG